MNVELLVGWRFDRRAHAVAMGDGRARAHRERKRMNGIPAVIAIAIVAAVAIVWWFFNRDRRRL